MRKVLTAALAVATLAGAAVATNASAEPWRHDGGWHERGDHDRDWHERGWRDRDWHERGWHEGWRGYGPRFGANYWGYYGGCRAHWVWSYRWGRYERVTACF